jgi:hypothetical protein
VHSIKGAISPSLGRDRRFKSAERLAMAVALLLAPLLKERLVWLGLLEEGGRGGGGEGGGEGKGRRASSINNHSKDIIGKSSNSMLLFTPLLV